MAADAAPPRPRRAPRRWPRRPARARSPRAAPRTSRSPAARRRGRSTSPAGAARRLDRRAPLVRRRALRAARRRGAPTSGWPPRRWWPAPGSTRPRAPDARRAGPAGGRRAYAAELAEHLELGDGGLPGPRRRRTSAWGPTATPPRCSPTTRPCASVGWATVGDRRCPKPPPERISLTLGCLNAARAPDPAHRRRGQARRPCRARSARPTRARPPRCWSATGSRSSSTTPRHPTFWGCCAGLKCAWWAVRMPRVFHCDDEPNYRSLVRVVLQQTPTRATRWSARPPTAARRSTSRRRWRPTSCCSTSTCRAWAASRRCPSCARRCPRPRSSR